MVPVIHQGQRAISAVRAGYLPVIIETHSVCIAAPKSRALPPFPVAHGVWSAGCDTSAARVPYQQKATRNEQYVLVKCRDHLVSRIFSVYLRITIHKMANYTNAQKRNLQLCNMTLQLGDSLWKHLKIVTLNGSKTAKVRKIFSKCYMSCKERHTCVSKLSDASER